jgi:hypothetical protein
MNCSLFLLGIFPLASQASPPPSLTEIITDSSRIAIISITGRGTRTNLIPRTWLGSSRLEVCDFDAVVEHDIKGTGPRRIKLQWYSRTSDCDRPFSSPPPQSYFLAFLTGGRGGNGYRIVQENSAAFLSLDGYSTEQARAVSRWTDVERQVDYFSLRPECACLPGTTSRISTCPP